MGRGIANRFCNWFATYMKDQRLEDLNSGFRIARTDPFPEFIYLLPNKFSYTTTITMAFFRAGYHVSYIPITAAKRIGKSHLRPLHDGARIFKIGTLYSPLRICVPVAVLFSLLGIGYWVYTYSTVGRLSIMTVFMLTTSVLVFLIGLVSEQITQLMYRPTNAPEPRRASAS